MIFPARNFSSDDQLLSEKQISTEQLTQQRWAVFTVRIQDLTPDVATIQPKLQAYFPGS